MTLFGRLYFLHQMPISAEGSSSSESPRLGREGAVAVGLWSTEGRTPRGLDVRMGKEGYAKHHFQKTSLPRS